MEEDGKKSNLTGLKPRAFVCDANTHVGQAVCRSLTKQGDYEVWGTLEDEEEAECKWVKQVVKREDPKHPISKCLLDSDLIVYQLKSGLDDATAALKLLMNSHYETEKTFILISSVLTWNDTKQNAELVSKEENEEEGAAEEEEVEQETLTEDMYNKRVPHVKYTAWKEIEKLCKKANSKTLHTYVLFSGLPYGEGEDKLHALFKQAWHLAPEGIPIFGTGKQIVPLVHVRDLATFVLKLATREDHEGARYCFACDEGNVTWNTLVKTLADTLGMGKTYRVPERDYVLYKNVEHFLVNLKTEAATMTSLLSDEEDWVSRAGFVENINKVVAEYLAHWKIQPLRLCILGPPASGKSHLGQKLAEHYKLPHLTVGDVVREYERQPVELQEQLQKIRQRRRDEKRAARLEEKRRLLAEQAAEREAQGDGDAEGEEEVARDPEEEPEEEEGEEEDEEDEVTEKIKERLNELQLILNMRVHPKGARLVEEEDKSKAKKPKPSLKGKLKKEAVPGTAPTEEVKPPEAPLRFTDKCLAIMYRWKLSQPTCRNQGYILDGYPKTVQQAKYLFEEGELEAPEEGVAEEEEELPPEEGEPKKAEDKLLPDKVVCLTARDEFLTERMMQITDQATHNSPADFQRRLDAFKAAAKPNGGVASWLESAVTNAEEAREVLVRAIAADTAPLLPPPPPISPLDEPPKDEVLAEAVEFVGVPHNYGPTPQEIEAAHLQELKKEQERQRLAEEAESQRLAAEARDREEIAQLRREEAARLAAIQQQERAMLELRKEPLKKYLMETVIPILTQGLIDVCEVRPEDPIDYLAEWLFRHNPQLEADMN